MMTNENEKLQLVILAFQAKLGFRRGLQFAAADRFNFKEGSVAEKPGHLLAFAI
jgi:hypothetical protein